MDPMGQAMEFSGQEWHFSCCWWPESSHAIDIVNILIHLISLERLICLIIHPDWFSFLFPATAIATVTSRWSMYHTSIAEFCIQHCRNLRLKGCDSASSATSQWDDDTPPAETRAFRFQISTPFVTAKWLSMSNHSWCWLTKGMMYFQIVNWEEDSPSNQCPFTNLVWKTGFLYPHIVNKIRWRSQNMQCDTARCVKTAPIQVSLLSDVELG